MADKLLGKERIKELWEEIKMLDIIEVAQSLFRVILKCEDISAFETALNRA
ncbi:MAG: hypothetical protein HQK66_14935 [Desulfamplus sp.]|nr:hypothetical protein [Desulfamplus sp.]